MLIDNTLSSCCPNEHLKFPQNPNLATPFLSLSGELVFGWSFEKRKRNPNFLMLNDFGLQIYFRSIWVLNFYSLKGHLKIGGFQMLDLPLACGITYSEYWNFHKHHFLIFLNFWQHFLPLSSKLMLKNCPKI